MMVCAARACLQLVALLLRLAQLHLERAGAILRALQLRQDFRSQVPVGRAEGGKGEVLAGRCNAGAPSDHSRT